MIAAYNWGPLLGVGAAALTMLIGCALLAIAGWAEDHLGISGYAVIVGGVILVLTIGASIAGALTA